MSMIMDNSCYTCRRRRIECEMTEPPCKKCKKAGLECFQKRPFRWVQGAAFRGKKKVSSVKDASVSVTKLNLESTRRDGSCTRIINYAESIADDDASLEYGEDTPGEIRRLRGRCGKSLLMYIYSTNSANLKTQDLVIFVSTMY